MQIADLFARLGVRLNAAAWAAADQAITRVKTGLHAVGTMAQEAFEWTAPVLGDLRKKLVAVIDDLKPGKVVEGLQEKISNLDGKAVFGWARAGASKLASMTMAAIEAGSQLQDLSAQTGIGVRALQELGHAAQLNGSDFGSMTAALRTLQRNMLAAKKSGSEQAKEFRKYGIAVKDSKGHLLGADVVLGKVANKLAKLPKEERAAVAMKLLGESASGLVPLLSQGSKALDEMRAKVRQFTLSEEEVGRLDEAGDAVDGFKIALDGLRNKIGSALAPVVTKFYNGLTRALGALADVFSFLEPAIVTVADVVGDVVGFIVGHVEILLGILGVLVIQFGAVAYAAIAAATSAAAAWLIALAPFVLMAAAIAGVIYLLEYLPDILDALVKAFTRAGNWIVSRFTAIGRAIRGVGGSIKSLLNDAASSIASAFDRAWEAIKQGARDVGNWLAGLPVIKQLIWAGKKVGQGVRYLSGDSDDDDEPSRAQPRRPSVPASASSGGRVANVNVNAPITINPAPGMDETKVGEAAARHVATTMRSASAATG